MSDSASPVEPTPKKVLRAVLLQSTTPVPKSNPVSRVLAGLASEKQFSAVARLAKPFAKTVAFALVRISHTELLVSADPATLRDFASALSAEPFLSGHTFDPPAVRRRQAKRWEITLRGVPPELPVETLLQALRVIA